MKWLSVLLIIVIQQCTIGLSSNKSKCPTMTILNGKVQRKRGKIIQFECSSNFTLVGNKYSTCVRGEWDTPAPVCISSECPVPPTPEHALVANRYDNGILIYFCEPNYELVGSPEIYCNGKQWNGTIPFCRDTTAVAPLKCDFEKTDLCWWEQDPKHDFDWQRHNFETPSSHIGTGPTHDHTLGAGNSGYYLYVEASGRLENSTARIISPLYHSNLTTNGCFSLWYHMYGATIGSLRVYFKPEISTENPRLMFEKHGNQGNNWYQGIFNLPPSNVNFQIIIEGVRGSSYVSDIAVDDVAILQGNECRNAEKNISATTVQSTNINEQDDQIELVNAMQSCYGRCGDISKNNIGTTIIPMTSPDACQCTIDCADNSTCCPDFSEYCVLGFSDGSVIDSSTIINSQSHQPEPKDGIDPNITLPSVISTSEKPTPPTPPPTTTTTTSTTTQKSITKLATTTRATTKKPSKMITTTTKAKIQYETPFVIATTTKSILIVEKVQNNYKKSSIIIFFVVPIGAIIIVGIGIFIISKRKNIYKGNSIKINSSALPEDSDVRFLTSDEVLDFNLAPMPEDYNQL